MRGAPPSHQLIPLGNALPQIRTTCSQSSAPLSLLVLGQLAGKIGCAAACLLPTEDALRDSRKLGCRVRGGVPTF